MAYCTLDDIKKALEEATVVQLTDDENLKPTAIDPVDPDHAAIIARVDEAIETAMRRSRLLRGKVLGAALRSRVVNKLPLSSCHLYLHGRRGIPEKIEMRLRRASHG